MCGSAGGGEGLCGGEGRWGVERGGVERGGRSEERGRKGGETQGEGGVAPVSQCRGSTKNTRHHLS